MLATSSTVSQAASDEEASSKELAQLLEGLAAKLPPPVLAMVLRPLPGVELARIACVHKEFWACLLTLRQQPDGSRYAPPSAEDHVKALVWNRMVRAGYYGDVAVLRAMITAGVDEHGTPLSESLLGSSANSAPSHFDHTGRPIWRGENYKTLDKALSEAIGSGHIHAVQLLYSAGADLMTINTDALRKVVRAGGSEPFLEFLRNSSSMDSQINLAEWQCALNEWR